MFSEVRESFNSVFKERITSPLYGAFIVSWLIWNWRILYLTFIVSPEKISETKIDYIIENYSDPSFIVWYPLLSTLILITIIPFFSNFAYLAHINFNKWRVDQRNSVEMKQLLTLEQSIELREELIRQKKRFDELLNDKNEELKKLSIANKELEEKISSKKVNPFERPKDSEILNLAGQIASNKELQKGVEIITKYSRARNPNLHSDKQLKSDVLTFFEINDLIDLKGSVYYWSSKGKEVLKLYHDKHSLAI